MPEVQETYGMTKALYEKQNLPLPVNSLVSPDGTLLLRRLDNAVIKTLHQLREDLNAAPYDTAIGFFEEGPAAFAGSAIREQTHVQIAVRNPESIVGVFRVV